MRREQFIPTTKKRGGWNAQHRQKGTPEKTYRKQILCCLQKSKSTQISESVVAGRIEQVKKSKFELELMKAIDCIVCGHINYICCLVTFKIKSL